MTAELITLFELNCYKSTQQGAQIQQIQASYIHVVLSFIKKRAKPIKV